MGERKLLIHVSHSGTGLVNCGRGNLGVGIPMRY